MDRVGHCLRCETSTNIQLPQAWVKVLKDPKSYPEYSCMFGRYLMSRCSEKELVHHAFSTRLSNGTMLGCPSLITISENKLQNAYVTKNDGQIGN